MNIFYRQGSLFKINEKLLPKKANTTQVKNALYAAVYEEFKGASKNLLYRDLNPAQKMQKLNEFAVNWLQTRGFI